MKATGIGAVLVLSAFLTVFVGCQGDDDDDLTPVVVSRGYKGHESDVDMNNLVQVYPAIAGTRLDDCQTCHRGGDVVHVTKGTMAYNPCAFCHLLPYPDVDLISGTPASYGDTLNPYGLHYRNAGDDQQALRDIGWQDSDVDGYTNDEEIAALRYPGDPLSKPGQPVAPIYTFTWEALAALPGSHTQFLLMNSHKQRYDTYAQYKGLTLAAILAEAGVDLTNATGVTVFAPDGYAKDVTIAELNAQYADGLYYGGLDDTGFGDPEQAFVNYPGAAYIPAGLTGSGDTLPDAMRVIIAYERDGLALDPSYLDPTSGRLEGEGAYRLVVPQTTPGSPDRGSTYSPTTFGDGWDYDVAKDHNAGLCVRGVVAIRVNPMPVGFEEFDWKNGGFSYLEEKKLFLYGEGVTGN